MIAMISQPMGGLTEEEILETRNKAASYLKSKGYTILNTYFTEKAPKDVKNEGVYYLGKSIEYMSKCDTVFFCKGWRMKKGCMIENMVAKKYGLNLIYEEVIEDEP